jgi:glycosyltransferase involved in cell wall biosynthesis
MRILLLHDVAAPRGGAEVLTLRLREALRARGHDVLLLAATPGGDGRDAVDVGCFGTDRPRLRTLTRTVNPSAARAVRRAVAAFAPDVAHVRMHLGQLSPAVLPALGAVPALYHAAMYEAVCPKGTKLLPDGSPCTHPVGIACHRTGCLSWAAWAPLVAQLRAWGRVERFGAVVANSAATRAVLLAGGVPGPIEVVPNGVPVRPARPPLPAAPVVAFAGRLVPEKGADVLLDAFARVAGRHPAARLLVAGDGPQRGALAAQAAAAGLGGRVELLGHLGREELERRFAGAWVQAAPVRWAEPFGLVAAEAAMRGTAVVASARGGLAEVVADGETGLLVPAGEAGALAGALDALLGDRERCERLGAAARRRALAVYAEDVLVDRLVALHARLAAGAPPRASA